MSKRTLKRWPNPIMPQKDACKSLFENVHSYLNPFLRSKFDACELAWTPSDCFYVGKSQDEMMLFLLTHHLALMRPALDEFCSMLKQYHSSGANVKKPPLLSDRNTIRLVKLLVVEVFSPMLMDAIRDTFAKAYKVYLNRMTKKRCGRMLAQSYYAHKSLAQLVPRQIAKLIITYSLEW